MREKHLESCFSLRLPLQELFDLLYVSEVEILRLMVTRATALCESRLAARHVVTLVREKHLESCFSLRLPLQELFDLLYVSEVEILQLKVPRATALCESRLAARHVVTLVREKHLESCFSLRLPLQELFDLLILFFVGQEIKKALERGL